MSHQIAQFVISIAFAMAVVLILASQRWLYKFWPMKKIAAKWMKVWIEDRLRRDREAANYCLKKILEEGRHPWKLYWYRTDEWVPDDNQPSNRVKRMTLRSLLRILQESQLGNTRPTNSHHYQFKIVDELGLGSFLPQEARESLMRKQVENDPSCRFTYTYAKDFWGVNNIPDDLIALMQRHGQREGADEVRVY